MKVAATVLLMQVTVHVSVLSDFLETEVLQKSDAGILFCSVDMVFSKVCKGRCKGKKGKNQFVKVLCREKCCCRCEKFSG